MYSLDLPLPVWVHNALDQQQEEKLTNNQKIITARHCSVATTELNFNSTFFI